MLSTMQDVPLQLRRLLEYGSAFHGNSKVVTAVPDGVREATYAQVGRNAARLANALASLGVGDGDRVATFMWNNQQHLEAYHAVPCMGAVLHPLNIRLPSDQLVFTANHAEDKVVIVDGSLLPLLAKLLPEMTTVEHVVVDGQGDTGMLAGCGARVRIHDYTELIAAQADNYPWPDVDERQAAAMCYTSGTTGDPKGVVYSHRSIYLHALSESLPAALDLSPDDRMLLVAPQFYVLAWGLPYAAFLTGTSLIMPGPFLQPEPLAGVIAAARPNKAAAVPTILAALLNYVEFHPEADISSLKEAVVAGSACPPSLFDAYAARGITLLQAWGMTETSPLGSIARVTGDMDPAQARTWQLSQGRFVAEVEVRVVGPGGSVLPHDGASVGEVEVRGPWVTGSYYGVEAPEKFYDGWLRTGDVGRVTPDGYLILTDRAKDVIKSGGELISSVELENHLMAHPGILEAAVVGVADERWGERPLACIVARDGQQIGFGELREFLACRVALWQLPERWATVSEVPKTSVGKFDKKVLRQRYAEGDLPGMTMRVPQAVAGLDPGHRGTAVTPARPAISTPPPRPTGAMDTHHDRKSG
jgi:fatty-acyl-CoA synthase